MTGKTWFTVMCPDGNVWPDEDTDLDRVHEWLTKADNCGCGQETGHHLAARTIPPWQPIPTGGES